MQSPSPSPTLAALRRGTAAAHQRLEAKVDIENVCRDVAAYRRLLLAFYGFYGPLETRLKAVPGWDATGFDWAERAKTGWLASDLQELGISADELKNGPHCDALPHPETIGGALGCCYVLEGATLGGRHITKFLEQSSIPAGARQFFAGYGERTGRDWREFCALLETLDDSESEAAVDLGGLTFAALETWMASQR